MSSILHQLFDQGLFPSEEIVPDQEEQAVRRKISGELKALHKLLPPEEANRLEELDDLYGQAAALYGRACFCHGFRLGAALAADILCG